MLEIGGVCQRKFLFQSPALGRDCRAGAWQSCRVKCSGLRVSNLISNRTLLLLDFNSTVFHCILTTFLKMKPLLPDLQFSSWRTAVRKTVRCGGRSTEKLFVLEDGCRKTVHVEDKMLSSPRYCPETAKRSFIKMEEQSRRILLNFRSLVFNLLDLT